MNKVMYLNLGTNLWAQKNALYPTDPEDMIYRDKLYFDKPIWDKIIAELPSFGVDTLVIGLAEGVVYPSHPELAVEGSFTVDALRSELEKIRSLGIATVPCVQLLPPHNAWLQDYAYMVGTDKFKAVCTDIISDVIDIFDTPEYFHLGFGEAYYESKHVTPECQPVSIVCSAKVLSDFAALFFDTVRAHGISPWIWADPALVAAFGGADGFKRAVPTDVILSYCNFDGIPVVINKGKDGYLFAAPSKSSTVPFYKTLSDMGYTQIAGVTRRLHPRSPKRIMEYTQLECDNVAGYIMIPEPNVCERKYYSIMNSLQNLSLSFDEVFGKGGTAQWIK